MARSVIVNLWIYLFLVNCVRLTNLILLLLICMTVSPSKYIGVGGLVPRNEILRNPGLASTKDSLEGHLALDSEGF